MELSQRIRAVVFGFVMRLRPPRPPTPDELERQRFSTHPGGKGLRFTERLRDAFRPRWLRIRRQRG